MRRFTSLLVATLTGVALAGCMRSGDSDSASRTPVGAVDGVTAGFVRSSDTFGTGRRVDVYGGSNSPVLPTIGAPGYGK